jgi:uncharacterized damage-inducible protein DinB
MKYIIYNGGRKIAFRDVLCEVVMLKTFVDEYERYKLIGQKAIDQVSDDGLNQIIGQDNNSIAVIVRHISGNLISRFTDFLTSDGEKPWRHRDAEFEDKHYSRQEITQLWTSGWRRLEDELAKLTDADLENVVQIRGQSLTVHEALARSTAHVAYHVGQIVLLGRILSDGNWQWISIPKGQSEIYNQNPILEKKPE